jgi:putative ABC transport system permease protein
MEALLARSQPQFLEGGPLRASDFTDPSHPGASISETLSVKHHLHVGDTLSLNTPAGRKDFTVRAVLVDYASPAGVVTVDAGVFRALWTDRLNDLLQVFVAPGADVMAVRQNIVTQLGEAHSLSVISNQRFREQMDETINRFFWLTRILILMAMLVAVLGIINSLQASVLDRTREIGMMRAVGAYRRQVALFIVLEAVAMALVAVVLGSVAGMFTGASMIETLMRNQTGWKLHFGVPWATLGFNTVITLGMAALSAWLPARKAARLGVTEALQFD